MKSSGVRYGVLGVLLAGAALIVWTAVSNGNPEDEIGIGSVDVDTTTPAETATTDAAAPTPEDSGGSGTTEQNAATTTMEPLEPIPVLGTATTLTGLDGWLNTEATSLEEIREANTITVVQFWTFGCRNCKNTLDALGRLYADFAERGVEIVGVHSPEFAYEADVGNIIEAADKLGVIWPIALDTHRRNFHRWQEGPTGYWPRVYVIDNDNQIRFDRRGDSAAKYRELYEIVERLLTET